MHNATTCDLLLLLPLAFYCRQFANNNTIQTLSLWWSWSSFEARAPHNLCDTNQPSATPTVKRHSYNTKSTRPATPNQTNLKETHQTRVVNGTSANYLRFRLYKHICFASCLFAQSKHKIRARIWWQRNTIRIYLCVSISDAVKWLFVLFVGLYRFCVCSSWGVAQSLEACAQWRAALRP